VSELPAGWVMRKVGEVGRVQLGRQRSPDVHNGPNMRPYLRVANVFEDRIDTSDVMEMHFSDEDFGRFELKDGDILLNEGQSRELVGRPAMYRGQLPGGCFTNSLVRFQASDDVEPLFALNLFRHYMRSGEFQKIAQITTNIAHLGAGRFAAMDFPLPPRMVQKRIVKKLQGLQARSATARNALARVHQLVEKLRQSILAAAFRGDLTKDWRAKNPDVEPASELLGRARVSGPVKRSGSRRVVAAESGRANAPAGLPASWTSSPIADVCPLQPGYAFKSKEFARVGIRLMRGTNIVPGGTRWEDVVYLDQSRAGDFQEYSLAAGDLVIAMDRPIIAGGIKVTRLATSDVPALLLQRVGRLRPSAAVDLRYVEHFLRSPAFLVHVAGQATGTQLPHISATDVGSAVLPLPPLEEQAEISARCEAALERARSIAAAMDASAARLEVLDATTLTVAFGGQLLERAS